MNSQLHVYLIGMHAGILTQERNGALTFEYDEGYDGVPLSLSMPVSNQHYTNKTVLPYFSGLLPDSPETRRNIAREHNISGNNPFALLKVIGLDCPGAVQVCTEEDQLLVEAQQQHLVPISNERIAARLSKARANVHAKWETSKEHWSLGGQQQKFALRLENATWFSCEGAAATTHIFKPGITDLRYEALNEYLCLKLAHACGVPAADATYLTFNEEEAIVVTRFDRLLMDDGNILRLHQEDFCQALGISPQNKYPEEGGPSANSIIKALKQTGTYAQKNIELFLKELFFNYLIAAPDAHAKNYSLLLDTKAAYLAPLYDVASMLPYVDDGTPVKLAMGIAGENRAGKVSSSRLNKFAQLNELTEYGYSGQELGSLMAVLAQRIPAALEGVLERNAHIKGTQELGARLLPQVETLCAQSLARLE